MRPVVPFFSLADQKENLHVQETSHKSCLVSLNF